MNNYLNTNGCYDKFKMLISEEYFVDKTMIIEKSNKIINTENRYLCITRQCRFGKTVMTNILMKSI